MNNESQNRNVTEEESNKIFNNKVKFKLTVLMEELNKPEGRKLTDFIIRHCIGSMKVNKIEDKVKLKFVLRYTLKGRLMNILKDNKNTFTYYDVYNKKIVNNDCLESHIDNKNDSEIREKLRYLNIIYDTLGKDDMIKYKTLIDDIGFTDFKIYKRKLDEIIFDKINKQYIEQSNDNIFKVDWILSVLTINFNESAQVKGIYKKIIESGIYNK